MSSDLAFVQHVSDFVREAGEVSYEKMFGEYAVYVGPKVVALVCDNSLFLKPTDARKDPPGKPDRSLTLPWVQAVLFARRAPGQQRVAGRFVSGNRGSFAASQAQEKGSLS
jgi:hypothetical protein